MNDKVLSHARHLDPALIPPKLYDYLTVHAAIQAEGSGQVYMRDWQLLIALAALSAPCSFSFLNQFFSRTNPAMNEAYYRCVSRLMAQGYAKQEYNTKGWRVWSITPEGRQAVQRLSDTVTTLHKKAG